MHSMHSSDLLLIERTQQCVGSSVGERRHSMRQSFPSCHSKGFLCLQQSICDQFQRIATDFPGAIFLSP